MEMSGPDRALSLSYGAFACTLEDFDRPLACLGQIAAFLQDMDDDPRFKNKSFRASDPRLLRRIVEREIAQKVEIVETDKGICLRQVRNILGTEPDVAVTPLTECPKPDLPPRPKHLARVIKLPRRELENALAVGNLEEGPAEPDALDPSLPLEPDPVSLACVAAEVREILDAMGASTRDEADLVGALARIEIESRQIRQERAAAALSAFDDRTAPGDDDREIALERLLHKTDRELDEATGHRRRSAIAHLKAAVVAANADDRLRETGDRQDARRMNRFREDLARRSLSSATAPSLREPSGRAGPLVLTPELRVESPAPETDSDLGPCDEGSFREFASRLGANSPADLVEAAVAFSMVVENRDGATLDDILRRSNAVSDCPVTRVEGMRYLGELLRTERIRTTRDERYSIGSVAKLVVKPPSCDV